MYNEPCVTIKAHEKGKYSDVLGGSSWRLLAVPGFSQQNSSGNQKHGSKTQWGEANLGVILQCGTWENRENEVITGVPSSRMNLPNVTFTHPLVFPGQWSPTCTYAEVLFIENII